MKTKTYKPNGIRVTPRKKASREKICQELQRLQRKRAIVLKSRNMQANRLQAIVAGTLGYHSSLPEKERAKLFIEATKLIKDVLSGEADSDMAAVIETTMIGINAFNEMKVNLEHEMEVLVKQLPIIEWVNHPDQLGFGLKNLAIVIGETGDLANYANPGKVWRRLGCAPFTKDGQTKMGSTWRFGKEGKLHASDWEEFGYSPRRRSVAYNVGEPLLKHNKGIYRDRYDATKARIFEQHPDWHKKGKKTEPGGRCHNHAMLLMTKLLLKNLWIEWNR